MYPLGGVLPATPPPPPESRRHVGLGLLVVALGLIVLLSSFVTWRVWGGARGPRLSETGWEQVTGGWGRGPLAALLGLALTCLGAAVAVGYRPRWVRWSGVAVSGGIVALAVLEWGTAGLSAPNAPGIGLWILLVAGLAGLFPFAALDPPPERA